MTPALFRRPLPGSFHRAIRRTWWRPLLAAWVGAVAAVGASDAPPVADPPRAAQDPVASFEATYKASVGLIPAWVEVSLRTDADGRLTFCSEVRGRGWASFKSGRIVEISKVRADGSAIRPLRYEMRNGFSRKDRDIVTRFDGDGSAVSTYQGRELSVRADREPVDLLTLRLVLSSDLAHDRLDGEYAIVDGKGRLQIIHVTDAGEEMLGTGAGRFAARRLEYASDTERRYVIWLAPALAWQMVRLEQYEDDRLRGQLVLHRFEPRSGLP